MCNFGRKFKLATSWINPKDNFYCKSQILHIPEVKCHYTLFPKLKCHSRANLHTPKQVCFEYWIPHHWQPKLIRKNELVFLNGLVISKYVSIIKTRENFFFQTLKSCSSTTSTLQWIWCTKGFFCLEDQNEILYILDMSL